MGRAKAADDGEVARFAPTWLHAFPRRRVRLAPVLVVSLALLTTPLGCTPARALGGEQCRNGIDDDLDGRVDCRDPECERELSCTLAQPFEPDVPAWLGDGVPGPDLGPSFEAACDPEAADDPQVYAVGCSLVPDDCGDGLRCVPLLIEGVVVETGCVRRGCAPPASSCSRVDTLDRQTVADACGVGALCVGFEDLDAGAMRCRPLCEVADIHAGACVHCRAIAKLLPVDEMAAASVEGLGVCADLP